MRTSTPVCRSAALLGLLLTGVVGLPAPTGAAPFPWAPPPVNMCGETGFDPLDRLPDPAAPPSSGLPDLPDEIDIPVIVPEPTPVPLPDPPQDNTRVEQEPLPADPCRNPCPEVRDTPEPVAEIAASSGSAELPRLRIKPEYEPIPIPVPGDGPGEPAQPAPERANVPAEPGPAAPGIPARAVESVTLAGQITGHGSINRTDMRWQVDGTDLGLMWEPTPGKIAIVFGDTFGEGWQYGGAGPEDADWRSNVLGYSTDRDLADGLTIDTMVQDRRCHAAELLGSRKIRNWETTTIPTSGFVLGKRQFLSYMSVNHWSRVPGMWLTNYGGLAYSDDGGKTWTKDQHARWENIFGLGRFQVAAMVPDGDYVYMFGTPNGRAGVIGLARVRKADVLNKTAYQYWIGGTWTPAGWSGGAADGTGSASGSAELAATPLVLGTASELSVRYDRATNQWQMVYLDVAAGAIVLRTADRPQGAWSDPVPLVSTADYPTAYGGFIHPWSTERDLYFTMSAWHSYNVYLMHARLKPAASGR
ncbi:DUF4185 domain-containing protein [Nocardia thailandica]|uniref:DUF4185 domain-containing protein n=1 Tax=Nocardia thailandica TaxID=257275 RepID=A0ABW6PGJ8_9NOCA|nr:DUF4185 domain-containing protein [Nocardia thailandica]